MTYMTEPSWGLPDPERDADLYADVPLKRAIAWVVDSILIFLMTLLVLPFTAFVGLLFYGALWLSISFLYRTLTIAGGSATLGMRLMSIQLRNARGERFGLADAVVHTSIYMVCFSFFIPQVISAVLMLSSSRGQGLSDLALGSTALNRCR
ncbi:RDD family protein [Tropicimonas isoalkanivorans]|uniref:RDD family protein n=1 Tax=Tropicimonas isoalkanivorans TaxID=441112 RepID=A0A1I1KBS5_9RHOB|nr:RDD family protein [Tropicimonas isoalkanivorans]SFC57772.1 RDD family protein [Tropicimonas isoalkanivorans]